MAYELIPPSTDSHGFSYQICENNHSKATSYLTYEFVKNDTKRLLVLTRNNHIIRDEQLIEEYDKFIKLIRSHQSESNIQTAKTIFNKIYDGEIESQYISTAIHRFGPVPVFKLPETYKTKYYNEDIECQIAIYPNIANENQKLSNYPVGVVNNLQFLNCLEKKFDFLVTRYFEDIGEYFFDIENHSNFESAYKNAKEIERIIGESIVSKLNVIGKKDAKNAIVENTRLRIFENHLPFIFKAQYVRNFVLYALNEFYNKLGLKEKDYFLEFKELKKKIKDFDRYVEDDTQLKYLSNALKGYYRKKKDGEIFIYDTSRIPTVWVKRYVDFLCFISTLKYIKSVPEKSKIFISYHHDVQISEILKNKIIELINFEFANMIEILHVDEDKPNLPFVDFIKHNIWLANSTFAILPRFTNHQPSNVEKNYKWITREACHTLLLNKELYFFQENGASSEQIKKDLSDNNILYLAPQARAGLNRSNKVLKHYEDKLFIEFNQSSHNKLDENLKLRIRKECKRIYKNYVFELVRSWLNLFSKELAYEIILINKMIREPRGNNQICKKVWESSDEKQKKHFRYLLRKTRERQLFMKNTYYSLIFQYRNKNGGYKRQYRGNIPFFIKRLNPDLDYADIYDFINDLENEYCC